MLSAEYMFHFDSFLKILAFVINSKRRNMLYKFWSRSWESSAFATSWKITAITLIKINPKVYSVLNLHWYMNTYLLMILPFFFYLPHPSKKVVSVFCVLKTRTGYVLILCQFVVSLELIFCVQQGYIESESLV